MGDIMSEFSLNVNEIKEEVDKSLKEEEEKIANPAIKKQADENAIPVPGSFEDDSWPTIAANTQTGIYKVGDTKTIKMDVNEDGEAIVYWAEHSKKYHVDKDCPALQNSENVYFGTVKAAYEKGLTEPCRRCIHELEEEHTEEEKQ